MIDRVQFLEGVWAHLFLVWHFQCQLVSVVGISRAHHTVFAEECVVNQRRVTVGHLGVDGKLGVPHILSVKCVSLSHICGH